jgi:hypothetical protein
MARILVEFPRGHAWLSGTPAWLTAVPARDKLMRLRALATECASILTSLRTMDSKLRQLLTELVGGSKTDTCTLLGLIDRMREQYERAARELKAKREEIDRLLSDPEVQTTIKPADVAAAYRAKKTENYFEHVVFAELPPKTPTQRTALIEHLNELRRKYADALADYNTYAPLAAKDWQSSAERLQAEARIAQAVERLIPAIRDYKAGKISEAEFNAKVEKEVLDAAADIAKIVQEWATKKNANAQKALEALSTMESVRSSIKAHLRECPELKAKYNVIDKPEGWDEWLKQVGLA